MNFNNFNTIKDKCPMDLRRHIGKFIDKSEINDPMRTLISKSFLEYNLKELPQSTLIKLFENGIYNKFKRIFNNRYYFGVGKQSESTKIDNITIPGPLSQFVLINLDTIYYGFTYSNDINDPKPLYRFDTNQHIGHDNINMSYVPVTNHDKLTDFIRVNDFAMLIRKFSKLGDRNASKSEPCMYKYMASKSLINLKNKILYEFVVILQYLGNKYRKINMENKKKSIEDKLNAKQEKLAAKEQANQEKLAAKEQAKQDKLASKEKTK